MMKMIAAGAVLALLASSAVAQVRVKGYTTKNGTYVAPHYRSSPNSTTLDNYSTRGNVNPYTGQAGTKDPASAYGGTYGKQGSNSGSQTSGSGARSNCVYYCY